MFRRLTLRRGFVVPTLAVPLACSVSYLDSETDNPDAGDGTGAAGGSVSSGGMSGASGSAATGGVAGGAGAAGASGAAGGAGTSGAEGGAGTGGATGVGGVGGVGGASGAAGTGSGGCEAITANPSWTLCAEAPARCEAVFYDGAGCAAVCAAVGLSCTAVYEDLTGGCAPDHSLPALSCSSPSGHNSDYCVCGT